MNESCFVVRALSEVWPLTERIEEKEKMDYLNCIKGMYFVAIGLKRQDVYHEYLLESIHLEHLEAHRIFTDY